MKRALLTLGCLFLASQAAAQAPSPAQLGITPTTTPENLQVLDSTKTWVPLGGVDPVTHTFTPVGGGGGGGGGGGTGEADILVTDPTIGMVSATSGSTPDNSPHVSALMAKMGPPSAVALMGYDVTFPSVPGQQYTTYYFSQPLVLSRGARYRCSGAAGATSGGYAQTSLVFAPGVDGVIQAASAFSGDGGTGGGTVENCGIYSLGYGSGTASGLTTGTPAANTQLTATANGGIAGIPRASVGVGDGIIVTPFFGRYYPWVAVPSVAPGAYVSGVSGSTLTLAAPYTITYAFGAALATFHQTGQGNFANGDTLTVGNNTFNFVTTLGTTPGNVLVGSDWYISGAHLAAAINGTVCAGCYVAPPNVPNVVSQAPISSFLGFWANFAGVAGNSLPVAYTGSAGAWQAPSTTTFAAGFDSNPVAYYQLPASQKFMVQTTVGSNSVTVISGPRSMRSGDVVWSDAFPFGTTVLGVSGLTFPQTVTMNSPFQNTFAVNATVTHAPGAEGQLWVIPAGLKRELTAGASYNAFQQWPIGFEMSCSTAGSMNCTVSHDFNNTGYINLFGRWTAGNTTGGSSSISDSYGKNFIADVMEGGTVGSAYFDLHSESPENGEGPYNIIGNCGNPNFSTFVGGYQGGTGQPNCAQQVGLFPVFAANKFLQISPQNTTPIGANVIGANGFTGSWGNLSGMNNQDCVVFGRGPGGGSPYGGGYILGVSNSACSSVSSTLALNFSTVNNAWDWEFSSINPIVRYVNTFLGYTGYSGSGIMMQFPNGALFAGDGNISNIPGSRMFGMATSRPAANWHLRGDTEISTSQSPGGQALWYYAPQFSTTLTAAVVKGTTTSVTVTACPTVTPPAGTLISDVSVNLSPNVNLGVFSSCSAGTLTFTAAALNSSFAATDAIQFLYPYPAGAISNDPNNPDYTATTIRSGSSANKDITGRITLAGGTATYTLTGVYATAPVCLTADATTPANASSVSESTTVLTFTGTGTDVIKYECVGRN